MELKLKTIAGRSFFFLAGLKTKHIVRRRKKKDEQDEQQYTHTHIQKQSESGTDNVFMFKCFGYRNE